jgi:hypothetical protein
MTAAVVLKGGMNKTHMIFEKEGLKRRKNKQDRRISNEKRSDWVRDNQWSSVYEELLRYCFSGKLRD